MTLNGVIAIILRFFSLNSITLQACYITVIEDKPILSSTAYHLPLLPKLTHPATRSLCDSWATCYIYV